MCVYSRVVGVYALAFERMSHSSYFLKPALNHHPSTHSNEKLKLRVGESVREKGKIGRLKSKVRMGGRGGEGIMNGYILDRQ